MRDYVTAEDGIRLSFERLVPARGESRGETVLLIHGFGSSAEQNWKSTGWYAALTGAGHGVVAMDCRGHGHSDKPHAPAFYGHDRMAADAALVMRAAGLGHAAVIGYSMGAFIALRLAAQDPARVSRLVLGGVGEYYLRGPLIGSEGSRTLLAEALLADDKDRVTDKRARMFRDFADQPGKDRLALAACMQAMSPPLPMEVLARFAQPLLVVCGALDDIAGAPEPLAAAFARGRAVTVPGRDHMSAVGDRQTRAAVLDFLAAAQA